MQDVFISVAPNGARKTQQDLPQLPITPNELADEALRCVNAGARLFHLHVRDELQGHSLDPQRYREALSAIRSTIGNAMILQVTTETVGRYGPHDMIASMRELVPEAFSVGITELIPSSEFEPEAKAFLSWAIARNIHVQYILYSDRELIAFADLISRGIIPRQDRYFVLFVLGKKSGIDARPEDLAAFLATKSRYFHALDLIWAVCAFGPQELACCLAAATQGGHVRIGFENNHHLLDGSIAPTTAALVSQFRQHLQAHLS